MHVDADRRKHLSSSGRGEMPHSHGATLSSFGNPERQTVNYAATAKRTCQHDTTTSIPAGCGWLRDEPRRIVAPFPRRLRQRIKCQDPRVFQMLRQIPSVLQVPLHCLLGASSNRALHAQCLDVVVLAARRAEIPEEVPVQADDQHVCPAVRTVLVPELPRRSQKV